VNLGKLYVPLVIYRPPSSLPDPTFSSHKSKALKDGHCRVKTSSIDADRGDDEIWIYGLAGSFVTIDINQIISADLHQKGIGGSSLPRGWIDRIW
jgi:hypothetical protein